ncbi:MAG TPA: calcium-binding protein, partial [Nitrososphaeraceae archaeon]
MIKIQYTLTFITITSLILPIQYQTLIFANGQMLKESNIIVYDDNNSERYSILDGPDNILLKPKVDVSIEGTSKNDKIKGGEGDDHINGNSGSDQLRGKEGDDEIDGGKGNDILHGEDGNDRIKGGEGSDRISGGIGNDEIEGESGDDKLFGGEGDDLLDGGDGNDVLLGGKGINIMIGGFGSDTFICNEFDRLIDFDVYKDQIIGPCSVEYLVEQEEEEERETIPEYNNNIFPLEVEESDERLFSSSQLYQKSPNYSQPPPPPLNS